MQVLPMTEADFAIWAQRSRSNYANSKMRANGLTRAEAEKIARDDFDRLLPAGLETANNFLFTAREDDGRRIGFVWYAVRGADDNRRAFISDIVVEEGERGKGYGKKIMRAVEVHAKDQGLKRIGLHVFGFNRVAIGLYQSLEYEVTDLVMEKSL